MTTAKKRDKSSVRVADLEWVQRSRRPTRLSTACQTMSIADMFCGCGGLTLGACEAARRSGYGVTIPFAIDLSENALEVYRQNFPESHIWNEDVTKLLGDPCEPVLDVERKLAKQIGPLSLLIAGPPCQGHSDLNNKSRRQDPRNLLYLKVVRAAELFRPSVVLIENVPTIVHDKANVLSRAKNLLTQLGYFVDDDIVSTLRVGVPQNRRRHILVATTSKAFCVSEFIEQLLPTEATLGDFLVGLEDEPDGRSHAFYRPARPTEENVDRIRYLFENDIYDLPNSKRPSCHRDKVHAYISMYGRMHWDKPAQTLTSGFGSMGQGRYVHPTRRRLITPHEGARIQGFPDFFSFNSIGSVTALREMIANAVPPQLSATFVMELLKRNLVELHSK